MPHPLITKIVICQYALYLPMLTLLHSITDRDEYEEHGKVLLANMKI